MQQPTRFAPDSDPSLPGHVPFSDAFVTRYIARREIGSSLGMPTVIPAHYVHHLKSVWDTKRPGYAMIHVVAGGHQFYTDSRGYEWEINRENEVWYARHTDAVDRLGSDTPWATTKAVTLGRCIQEIEHNVDMFEEEYDQYEEAWGC